MIGSPSAPPLSKRHRVLDDPASPAERAAAPGLHAVPWAPLALAPPPLADRLKRLHVALRRVRRAPPHRVVKPAVGPGPWALYFVYAPDGRAYDQHRFTLAALRSQGFRTLVVLAAEGPPDPLFAGSDALIVKGLPGFDFSGYAIGLAHLASAVGGTDVAVMNDSVFGPFADLAALLARTPWRLTGFTASFAIEPHLQSYAFLIRNLDAAYLRGLRSVLWRRWASSHHGGVTYLQESRLARIAGAMDSVGAIWAPAAADRDLSMADPLGLLDAGFPFLKRSLLGKFAAQFDTAAVEAALAARGHPVTGPGLFPDLLAARHGSPAAGSALPPSSIRSGDDS